MQLWTINVVTATQPRVSVQDIRGDWWVTPQTQSKQSLLDWSLWETIYRNEFILGCPFTIGVYIFMFMQREGRKKSTQTSYYDIGRYTYSYEKIIDFLYTLLYLNAAPCNASLARGACWLVQCRILYSCGKAEPCARLMFRNSVARCNAGLNEGITRLLCKIVR